MKMRAFLYVALCSLVGVDRPLISLTMDAVRTSETSFYSSETTRRYIPEASHLHDIYCLLLAYTEP
jgi:hypothetical protein